MIHCRFVRCGQYWNLGRLTIKGWQPRNIVEALFSPFRGVFGDYFLRKFGARMESRETIKAQQSFSQFKADCPCLFLIAMRTPNVSPSVVGRPQLLWNPSLFLHEDGCLNGQVSNIPFWAHAYCRWHRRWTSSQKRPSQSDQSLLLLTSVPPLAEQKRWAVSLTRVSESAMSGHLLLNTCLQEKWARFEVPGRTSRLWFHQ